MTEACWGSAENFMASRWLANAILKGFEEGVISWEDFHFGIDQIIWDRLSSVQDPFIQNQMQMIRCPSNYYRLVDSKKTNVFIYFKCRGIDPWIKHNGQVVRLTSIDPVLKQSLEQTQQRSIAGWPVEFLSREEIPVLSNFQMK
jgi:hypothetical protein